MRLDLPGHPTESTFFRAGHQTVGHDCACRTRPRAGVRRARRGARPASSDLSGRGRGLADRRRASRGLPWNRHRPADRSGGHRRGPTGPQAGRVARPGVERARARSGLGVELAGIDPVKTGVRDGGASTPTGPGFGPFPDEECERRSLPWTRPITPEGFRAYLATDSGAMLLSASERAHKLDSSGAVVRAACGTAGTSSVAMRHTATCYRWRLTAETGA